MQTADESLDQQADKQAAQHEMWRLSEALKDDKIIEVKSKGVKTYVVNNVQVLRT